MAWSHFTSYLDGTRSITKAERDELYDQLQTKLDAGTSGITLNASDMAEIKGSLFLTDLASHDGETETPPNLDNLNNILFDVAPFFADFYSVRSSALSAEGLTDTTLNQIIDESWDAFQRWNFYRRVIDGITP